MTQMRFISTDGGCRYYLVGQRVPNSYDTKRLEKNYEVVLTWTHIRL